MVNYSFNLPLIWWPQILHWAYEDRWIQLLTFGGLGIWVLMDLIMIALGKFKDSLVSSIEKVKKHSDALMQRQLEIAEKESKPEYRFPKINKNAYDFIKPFLRERIITKGY